MINEVVALVRLHDLEFGPGDASDPSGERAQSEIDRCRSELDRSVLARYDQVKRRFGASALAESSRGACAGCRMAIASMTATRLRNGKVTSCDNCGRFIYSPEYVYRFQY